MKNSKNENIVRNYNIAKEMYAEIGVDTDKVLHKLAKPGVFKGVPFGTGNV